MRRTARTTLTLLVAALSVAVATQATAAKKTEEQLIALLASPDEGKVVDALQDLEKGYPDSPTAHAKIASMLDDPREKVRRKAARVMGALHLPVTKEQLASIASLLDAPGKDAVIDGLKALRGLKAGSTVPKILPLLKSPDDNVKRDSCRTLAEIADASVIPSIEPLLSDPSKKVQEDARDAIGKLKLR